MSSCFEHRNAHTRILCTQESDAHTYMLDSNAHTYILVIKALKIGMYIEFSSISRLPLHTGACHMMIERALVNAKTVLALAPIVL